MDKYWSYDPENSWQLHATLNAARTCAEQWLEADRQQAGEEGWHPDVTTVAYGKLAVIGQVQQVSACRPYSDIHGAWAADHFTDIVEYELTTPSETTL